MNPTLYPVTGKAGHDCTDKAGKHTDQKMRKAHSGCLHTSDSSQMHVYPFLMEMVADLRCQIPPAPPQMPAATLHEHRRTKAPNDKQDHITASTSAPCQPATADARHTLKRALPLSDTA